MKKKLKTPRVDHRAARIDTLKGENNRLLEEREADRAEVKRTNEAAVRAYRLLATERGELLARADKLLAVMMAMEVRIEDGGSPVSTRVTGWTR